jgi:hypothetical protein
VLVDQEAGAAGGGRQDEQRDGQKGEDPFAAHLYLLPTTVPDGPLPSVEKLSEMIILLSIWFN